MDGDDKTFKFEVGQRVYNTATRRWAKVTGRELAGSIGNWYYLAYDNSHGEDQASEKSLKTEEPPDLPAAPPPPALSEGEEITVVWGEEKYSPKPYMNFAVGPVYAKSKIRPGETAEEAHARVWKWLEARAREQFNSQLNRFRINLQEL